MNNKGFMMAEVIVVAAIILVAITGFYSLYTSAISAYNTKINYYDVSTLYALAAYKNNPSSNPQNISCGTGCVILKDAVVEKVYSITTLNKDSIKNFNDIKPTLMDYLNYLSANLENTNIEILVMEKCKQDKEGNYTIDCKYAYLETAVK